MAYQCIDNWARIPDSASGRNNGRTHGIVVSSNGNVIVFHQAEDGLLTYDSEGNLISALGGTRWLGAHGMTLFSEGSDEFLWLADLSSKEVAKVTLAGETIQTLEKPDIADYHGDDAKAYVPTWAAQSPDNGDIWVANGYGSNLVHRYDTSGSYQSTLRGSEQAGEFREPHGINFRSTDSGAELWITDRANHQIQVFDSEGVFLRASKSCHSPCCFDFREDTVLVPELFTGAKVIQADTLDLIEEVGASDHVAPHPDGRWWPPVAPDGWPNLANTEWVQPGTLNSPHGGCFDHDGNIFIVEWIIGGRITKFVRQ